MIQRGGAGVVEMLAQTPAAVQQRTLQPILAHTLAKGTLIQTAAYDIDARVPD